jgi:hypothetical protein
MSKPYGIIHFFPGGTREQYEATLATVHPAPDVLPDGQIYHAAGTSAGGFTITAVHESQKSWETFRDEILAPKLQAGIPGGFEVQPVETTFDVTNLVTQKGKQIILT